MTEDLWILLNHGERTLEDWRCRALVLLQRYDGRTWEVALEQAESRARSATEPIDCLVRITHREYVSFLAGKRCQNLHLGKVGILKFIHQHESRPLAFTREQIRIRLKETPRACDHVAEGA